MGAGGQRLLKVRLMVDAATRQQGAAKLCICRLVQHAQHRGKAGGAVQGAGNQRCLTRCRLGVDGGALRRLANHHSHRPRRHRAFGQRCGVVQR